MKWIDLPPIWLLCFAIVTWLSRAVLTVSLPTWAGTLLVAVGLILMAAAIWQMQRHRTTVIPHLQPSALVQSGVFAYSRNPIYLGDALILAGLSLRWDAPLGLLLVPIFAWVIHIRFIVAEEKRLRDAFPQEAAIYMHRTRRWI